MNDIKVLDELTGKEVYAQPEHIEQPKGEILDGNTLVSEVASLFDLKPSEISMYKGKLDTLIDYAKSVVGNPTTSEIKWAIRQLSTKLGTPPLGEKPIKYLTTYAFLHMEGLKIEQEKAKFLTK